MTHEPGESCGWCRFSHIDEDTTDGTPLLLCRRFPPVIAVAPDGEPTHYAVEVEADAWCGEYVKA